MPIRLPAYEIASRLGAGGMGEVYRARDTRLDRTVAIKLTLNEDPENPQARLLFQREGRAIAATVHDSGPRPVRLDGVASGYRAAMRTAV